MPGVICQNKSVAECLKKESDFFKSLERFEKSNQVEIDFAVHWGSLERFEKSNQVESVVDLILRTFDFANSFSSLSQVQKNQVIYHSCIAIAFSESICNIF